jgi:hypothetical protein
LTLARNGVTSSFAVPASGALSTNLYLGAINNNGLALGSSPYNISFASVGTGLTGAEINNLNRLTYNLQLDLRRFITLNRISTSNLLASYSLRKTNSIYSGPLIRVRRSTDNNETDIGVDTFNMLDINQLIEFASGGNVFIKTWYDQSGNSKHISQNTAGNQPQIIDSGSLYYVNNRPAIYFNNKLLSLGSALNNELTQVSSYTVYTTLNDVSYSAWSTGNSSNYWMYTNGYQGFIGIFTTNFTGGFPARNTANGNWLFSTFHTGSSRTIFVNNTQYGPETSLAFTPGTNFTVGGTDTGAGGLTGYIQEINLYNTGSISDRTDIEFNINTYYQIY